MSGIEGSIEQHQVLGLRGTNMAAARPHDAHPKNSLIEKNERPKAASVYGRTNHAQSSKDLALQMYSHMKVQRQLEHERDAKISRTERKRQKLKRELQLSSSSLSSRDGFGPKWTQARCGHGLLGQRRLNGSHTQDTIPDTPKSATDHVIPFDGDSNNNYDDRVQNLAADAPTTTTNAMAATKSISFTNDMVTQTQIFQPTDIIDQSSPRNTFRSDADASQNGHAGGTFHVIKGPGRVHIRFAPSGSRSPSKTDPRKSKFQWDNMPAGTLVSSHLAMVNIDGEML